MLLKAGRWLKTGIEREEARRRLALQYTAPPSSSPSLKTIVPRSRMLPHLRDIIATVLELVPTINYPGANYAFVFLVLTYL